MNRGARLIGYLIVLSALAALLVVIPSAWATPEQSQSAQMTIPTRTPKPPTTTSAPAEPTDKPPPTSTPARTSTTAPATQSPPGATATTVPTAATAAAAAQLTLKKEVSPLIAWPGATVRFTLTLTNRGTASARQIVIQDILPGDLVPGSITAGPDASWDGQTLQALAPVLPPGAQLVVAYTADVRPDAPPGGVIANNAIATAASNLRVAASASVSLPPAELPPTGGSLTGPPVAAAAKP